MVFDKIRAIISDQTGKNENDISMETNFREELNADSLDLFQIINDIEDEFNVTVDDLEKIITVGDAVRIVEEAVNK